MRYQKVQFMEFEQTYRIQDTFSNSQSNLYIYKN